ncbi:MAG TPA: CPBP family intramembrane glutamic endopeptidase [Candidatus Polarisedimenticolaceae bacterium]|nr:CPBP family intramembrane glutamic endopeptidase [Candidatus Polarisedimenticolaceae bacterium]
MRIPRPLAWLLLALTLCTAGLLRQFHDRIPRSPYVTPIVGSLLFAAVFLLLLVSAREWRLGAVPGAGVRLGSLTPLLLMLLGEKWFAINFYGPVFNLLANPRAPANLLDAQYRLLAGGGLLVVCLFLGRLSAPSAHKTWRRIRPARWPLALGGAGLAIGATYLVLGGASWALGGSVALSRVPALPPLPWVLGGQALLALAEELFFRGLLLSELERLAPRLGARSAPARRWTALVATATLFGLEHLVLSPPWDLAWRRLVFTIALGLLFGLLIMVSANLLFAAVLHAWINWLLLDAVPHFVDGSGQPLLPSGTYVGMLLVFAFLVAFGAQALRRRAPSALADAGG